MVRDKLALVTLAHQLAVAYSLGGLVIQSGSASVSLCTPRQLLGTFVHHDAYICQFAELRRLLGTCTTRLLLGTGEY